MSVSAQSEKEDILTNRLPRQYLTVNGKFRGGL